MIRRPPRSTQSRSSAASDVYKRQMLKTLGAVVLVLLLCLPLLAQSSPYLLILSIDVLIAVLFATSLHFIMGPGGMHSFGHAAYFGLGASRAALLVNWLSLPTAS